MYLIPFHLLFPDLAQTETRSLTLFEQAGIPADKYGLVESYCPDPTCDCQRVMLNVFANHQEKQAATINYGFNRASKDAGPFLDPFNPQSPYAPALMKVIARHLESDAAYVLRLKAHYALVKSAAANPNHPAQKILIPWRQKADKAYAQDEQLAPLREAEQLLQQFGKTLEQSPPKKRRPSRKK